jgi:hypothetical protein
MSEYAYVDVSTQCNGALMKTINEGNIILGEGRANLKESGQSVCTFELMQLCIHEVIEEGICGLVGLVRMQIEHSM